MDGESGEEDGLR